MLTRPGAPFVRALHNRVRMKRCPAPWAIMVCEIWLVSMILMLCWGILGGAPVAVANYHYALGPALGALIFVERTVLLQRWSFIVLGLIAIYMAGGCWFATLFVIVDERSWVVYSIWHTVACIALWCCVFAKEKDDEERQARRKLALRTSLGSAAIALVIAAVLFYKSFQAPSISVGRIAKRSELTGLWYGTRPSKTPHIQAFVLTLMTDGTGSFKAYKKAHNPGFKVQWLLRGNSLHISIWRQPNRTFVPVLADDAHALFLQPTSLDGVSNFKREPYNVITGTGE